MEPPSSSTPSSQPSAPLPTEQQQQQQQPQQPQQQQPQQQQLQQISTTSSSSSSSSSIQNPNQNPTNPQPCYPQQQQLNIRTTPFNRPWSQPTSQFPPQFHSSSSTTTTITTSSSSSSSSPLPQRGGIAIGVSASPQPTVSFVPSQFPSSVPSSTARPPSRHGMPNMGMMATQIRPGAVAPSALHQQRPVQAASVQSVVRPLTKANSLPSASPQNFQAHGMLRAPSVTPPSTSQSQQSPHQPWLSASHSRPPFPSQSYRPQVNPQSLQERSHIPQQSPQTVQATQQQPHQLLPSPQRQQHIPASNQSQENYGNQLPSSRVLQPSANQQQVVRVQGSAIQKPPSPAMGQASIVHPGPSDISNVAELSEPCSTILSKRSIQELVNQIDPSEKLDSEVEDALVDIAEDFIDSVTTFGCSLAKHRKSNTLEAKDILLHLDRTWNMTLPGFSGDEIKTYKKPVVNDIHKERLALIKKSYTGAESKTSSGPGTGNVKGHLARVTPNVVGS